MLASNNNYASAKQRMTKATDRTGVTIREGADKVVDLYGGAGGLSLGAARAGFSVYCAVENDPHAAATHRRNFPRTLHLEEDVAQLTGERLRAKLGWRKGELAGIIGGPPCQGFSCIGKNQTSDPRNRLFIDFFRIV